MTDRRDDDADFAASAEELSTVLQELRDELRRDPPRGPFGLPRPPSPSEVVRFADEVAIPGTIAVLEVNIKLLETVQRAIRIVDTGNRARERADDARDRASGSAERLADVSDKTLRRLEGSLSDLQSALDDGDLPDEGAAGELLSEARGLRDDVQSRLREARERDHTLDDFEERANRADDARRADAAREDDPGERSESAATQRSGTGDGGVKVDVDAEIETLKDRYGKGEESNAGTDGDASAGEPGDDTGDDDAASDDAGSDDAGRGGAEDAGSDDSDGHGDGGRGDADA
ncbi:hypothetical protein [Halorubellus sp. PRR65]|uniref:DUF7547 family protein n=1 Tax=Halorubellus sp. PRR65 TaxID=3098148 RepID=UPI002B26135E|nr:hypothetical protein [Halorubellus sp. PRR65]